MSPATDPAGNVLQKPGAGAGTAGTTNKPQAGAGGFTVDYGKKTAQEQQDSLLAAAGYDPASSKYDFMEWGGGRAGPVTGIEQRLAGAGLVGPGRAPKTFTAVTAIDRLRAMSPEERAAVQKQLYDGGWYARVPGGSDYYRAKDPRAPAFGNKTLDNDTYLAFSEAMGFSINTNQSLDDVLAGQDGLRMLEDERRKKAQERAPLVIQLTPDETMRSVARQLWMKEAGRDPSPAELNRLIASYRGIETSAQQRQYEMTGSGLPGGTGGTIVAPPSPEAYVAGQVGHVTPVEVGAQRIETGLAELRKLFTGGGGGG